MRAISGRHNAAFPRHARARVIDPRTLSLIEGAGNAGRVERTRSLACKGKSTQASHRRFAEYVRHSPRNGFNGFLRGLPGDRAFLPPSPADCPANLIPASRYQDATTSPSATGALVVRTVASIASPAQRLVTIAKRPSSRAEDARKMPVICPTSQANLRATRWHDGQIR
jgi:hypothetical protein